MVLRDQETIHMMATGLSNYRALLDSLNPKNILVEEA
jgi:hypothetical protein